VFFPIHDYLYIKVLHILLVGEEVICAHKLCCSVIQVQCCHDAEVNTVSVSIEILTIEADAWFTVAL